MPAPKPTTLSPRSLARIGTWLTRCDTGISSKTIVAIAMGATRPNDADWDAPYDVSDFGRCVRLLHAVPELREHLPAVARRMRVWRGLVKHWDELERIYHRDFKTGESKELYRRIAELRGDRPQVVAGWSKA